MIFKGLKGRNVKVKKPYKYKINWEAKSLSKVQKRVKDLIKEYWECDFVYEELPVGGTRLSFDFYNASKKIAIEVDGPQHYKYNKHFHSKSKQRFLDQLIRDDDKERFCELNNITLYRIRSDKNLEEQLKDCDYL